MVSERHWLFNTNTNRNGVWHIIEGDLNLVAVPENVYEYESDIKKYHSSKCSESNQANRWVENTEFGSASPWRYRPQTIKNRDFVYKCICSADTGTDEGPKIVGTYTRRHIRPEHIEVRNQSILCHYTKLQSGGLNYSGGTVDGIKVPGGVLTETSTVSRVFDYIGELPAGPICSRCVSAAEKLEAANGS